MAARGTISPQRASQARRGSTTKRWPAPVAAVVIAAAVCVALAAQRSAISSSGLALLRLHLAAAAAAGGAATAGSQPQCSPPFVGSFTSHKTGTAQAGCLVALAIGGAIQPVAHHYENAPDGPQSAVKFAEAAAAGGTCPTAVFYTAGDYLPRLADAHCPFPACPCTTGGKARCESLEGGALDVPERNSSGSTTLIHIVRSPLDVVLSAYFFHRQDPAPEPWIEAVSANAFGAAWFREGTPLAPLQALGWRPGHGFAGAGPGQSYGSFLRQLPPEQGVRLEFWRSSRSLFGTARMHASLKALAQQQGRGTTSVLPLRFEALRDDFNATAGAMLAAVGGRVPGLDAGTLLEQAQECNPGAWSAEQQAANAAHVTAGQGGPQLRSRLQAALWGDGAIRRRLCQLTAALDYPLPPQCSSGSSSSSSSSTTAVQTE